MCTAVAESRMDGQDQVAVVAGELDFMADSLWWGGQSGQECAAAGAGAVWSLSGGPDSRGSTGVRPEPGTSRHSSRPWQSCCLTQPQPALEQDKRHYTEKVLSFLLFGTEPSPAALSSLYQDTLFSRSGRDRRRKEVRRPIVLALVPEFPM